LVDQDETPPAITCDWGPGETRAFGARKGGSWPNHDAAYAQIAMELRTVVERLRKSR